MIICAVLVTYANRSALCIRAAGEALAQGIARVIIVDNGSVPESAAELRAFALHRSPAVEIVPLAANSGSAIGFATGIAAFLSSGADVIWMLDDDNLLAPGSAEKMTKIWNRLPDKKTTDTALAAFRVDRHNYATALSSARAENMLPPYNAYDGFHLNRISAFFRVTKMAGPRGAGNSAVDLLSIPVAAYGGLWMHRELCLNTSPPDARYLLYMDDFDYTWRLTSGGARILLTRAVELQDIEPSYYLPVKKNLAVSFLTRRAQRLPGVLYLPQRGIFHGSLSG